MARSVGSTFDTVLPIAKKYRVGAVNWGFVVGKTQTNLPWDSWQRPYVKTEPQYGSTTCCVQMASPIGNERRRSYAATTGAKP